MSAERPPSRRIARTFTILAAVFGVAWVISPQLYLSGLRVEAARVIRTVNAEPGTPDSAFTRERIRVVFTTPQDLAAYRAKWGLPFIHAGIAGCADRSAGTNDELVIQDQGYFVDDRRVRTLGRVGGEAARYAYQADFDNRLTKTGDDHQAHDVAALSVPGGLCFRLHGATLVRGSVRSATIPLKLPSR